MRCLLATLICSPTLAAGQISGQLYLEKSSFAQGEPVFLYFEVVNTGPRPENFYQADPYSFCAGYEITVNGPKPRKTGCEPWGSAGSCISSDRPLAPGETRVERRLLNFDHELNQTGDYTVEAVRRVPKIDASTRMRDRTQQLEFHSTLYFHVEETPASEESFQPWINQLKSGDQTTRYGAARVLASLAPHSLEDVILNLAASQQLSDLGPLALHRLNTARSMAAMADLLRKSEFGSSESMWSDQYLAETGDRQWICAGGDQ
jgi:hypothetical protein